MSGLGFIAPEPHDVCEECGKTDELRPYGINGARICFDCAMKDDESKARAERAFCAHVLGETRQ